MKNLLFAALAVLTLFASCKKKNSDTPVQPGVALFTINGVHDLDFGTNSSSYLNLQIVQTAGAAQERVSLSVTGLPSGVRAIISPGGGTPNFDASIIFEKDAGAVAGIYTVQIVGASSSYTKSIDLKLKISPSNRFVVNGTLYETNTVGRNQSAGQLYFHSISPAAIDLTFSFFDIPQAEGSHTYHLDGNRLSGLSMHVACYLRESGKTYFLEENSGRDAVVNVTAGKISVHFDDIVLTSNSGETISVSADVFQ